MKNKKKIAVGMSGGVDSAVSASLLKEAGHDVAGVFIEAWNEPGCRTDQDREDALRAALKIGIPFQVIDAKREYGQKVIDYFYDSYARGLTPNPDVLCNSEIKFGMFYGWARDSGYDAVATGHYSRIRRIGTRAEIVTPRDKRKDQTYFLYKLKSRQLDRIVFPLGDWTKGEARDYARGKGLDVSDKPDSMGVCFIGEGDVRKLIRDRLGDKPGNVVYRGMVIGKHKGMWFHTIGQRGGFEVDKKKLKEMGERVERMEPLYVVGKNPLKNEVMVGMRAECYKSEFIVKDVTLVNDGDELEDKKKISVRIRNLGDMVACRVIRSGEDEYRVETEEELFAVSPGQSAVFYGRSAEDSVLIGGGVIV